MLTCSSREVADVDNESTLAEVSSLRSSAMASKLKYPCAGFDLTCLSRKGCFPRLGLRELPAAAVAFSGCLLCRLNCDRKRFVLKSMISISKPFPVAAGVISSLSIVPVRIPKGRSKRKRSSLHNPEDEDCGFLIADCGLRDSPFSRLAADTRWKTSLTK